MYLPPNHQSCGNKAKSAVCSKPSDIVANDDQNVSDEFDAKDNMDIAQAFHPILERHFDNFENSSLAGLKDFCHQCFPGSEKYINKRYFEMCTHIFCKIICENAAVK